MGDGFIFVKRCIFNANIMRDVAFLWIKSTYKRKKITVRLPLSQKFSTFAAEFLMSMLAVNV